MKKFMQFFLIAWLLFQPSRHKHTKDKQIYLLSIY